ncbi:MAG: hypothetical protein R8F63_00185 [Acidimicrobiales bacterium]|nr:hypothetical protein [Acidimicrobiales bacterium]
MATRRYGTIVKHLTDDPDTAVELAAKLNDEVLHHLAEALHDEARRRAIAAGDHAALIAEVFETGFGRDGLGVDPWIEGDVVVCPGAMVAKSKSSHRCRFVSVDDVWIWESGELIQEDKRSNPGPEDGFRAVALLPILNGMTLDVVTGRARGGQHSVDRATSYVVRRGKLVEVSQRNVSGRGMQ